MPEAKLSKISTKAPGKLDKDHIKADTAKILEELDELQNLLFAEHKHSLLVVLQGMDASGKDGVIRNVFGKLNPQGVQVYSFKAPTEEEKSHDFLWRIHKVAPGKGHIHLLNRSHYEDVLIQRVHKWVDKATYKKRYEAINAFERLLTKHNDTQVLKFYLHISPEEQQERLAERMQDPRKMWKYNANDFEEAKLWDEYHKAYEDAFENCNDVPWIIVPSDQNWYKEYLIARTVRDTLVKLKMKYPGLKKT
ncbi:PPK2 family polyphosphate kinase [uncultured Chitinophaga sp.]|uniref:PPK2 family polyphosphate kinase n=1 Tax=uncultured Chitinophaga sp. TaxID=339340 RepID=UPI0025E9C503|nr:PPK2 family polyphosphate kinase [uncultured Chitinophaga sp.]